MDKARRFIDKGIGYKQLKAQVSFLIPHRSDVKLVLYPQGGSYTDNKKIIIGIPDVVQNKTEEEIFTVLRALVGHEAQHVNSSSFSAYSEFIGVISRKAYNLFGINKTFGEKIACWIGNSIEDGRIEKILCNKYPGYTRYLKYYRGLLWDAQPVDGESELKDFMYSVTSLTCIGLLPKDYEKFYKGSELDENIQKIMPLINKGIDSRTCQDALFVCEDIFKNVIEYISRLYNNIQSESEFMNNLPSEPDFKNSEESEMNDSEQKGSPVHFIKQKNESKESEENNNKGDSQISENMKNDSIEDENICDSDTQEDGDAKKSTNTDDSDDKKEMGEKNKSQSSSNSGDSQPSESEKKSNESGSSPGEYNGMSEDEMKKAMEEIRNDVASDAAEKLKEKKKTEKNIDTSLTNEDKNDIGSKYRDKVSITERKLSKDFLVKAPEKVKRAGIKMQKDIEKVFKNRQALNLHSQKKGVLNSSDIWKVGITDYNVFTKKGHPVVSDFAGYMLLDGSGSMNYNDKYRHCLEASGIIEHALTDIMPLKIVKFASTYIHSVQHFIIKDFDEKPNGNASITAINADKPDNRNKDGYSIRVATKELEKRPEKDKILIILSDGLPSSYHYEEEAMNDVKLAVKEARKKGIQVFMIMFGPKESRDEYADSYRAMYEKNIISCEPENIATNLSRLITKVLTR